MSDPFENHDGQDAADLIAEYPLAWVSAAGAQASLASLLPLLAERDAEGRVTALIGHMARRNPLYAALSADPRALILFQGPQSYVSPDMAGDRAWVPTWIFAQLSIETELRFLPEGGDAALEALVNAMEAGRAEPWAVAETGPRYRAMEQMIIAFRAEVRTLRGRFKLGQDETPDVLQKIVAHLSDPALVRWVRRMNKGRLEP
jgi:transcriptional regulator